MKKAVTLGLVIFSMYQRTKDKLGANVGPEKEKLKKIYLDQWRKQRID